MENVNFDVLFGNFTAADALAATKSEKSGGFSRNPDLYKPSINDEACKDMNYRALGRFVPFYRNGKWDTIVTRWECFLKDVNGENGMFVVSPKTDNEKRRCPMRTLSYQLYKSDNAVDKENSKKIQVYQQYYALFEIVKDVQHPELNGKIVIYQFGQKVKDILEVAMEKTEFTEGCNPFDFWDGKLFEINLKKDPVKKMGNGKPVTDYNGCRFIEKTAPIHFQKKVEDENGDTTPVTVTLSQDDSETKKEFFEWLEKDAPKISDYFWKEWDSETEEKVNTLLATYKSGYSAPRPAQAAAKEVVNSVADIPETPQPKPAPVDDTMPFPMPDENETSVTDANDAWIDDILNG